MWSSPPPPKQKKKQKSSYPGRRSIMTIPHVKTDSRTEYIIRQVLMRRFMWNLMFPITVMIRFSAQGASLLLVPQGKVPIRVMALDYFFENKQIMQNKALMFVWKRSRRLENGLVVRPRSFLAVTTSQAVAAILRRDHSFEGTVLSRGHYGSETKTAFW